MKAVFILLLIVLLPSICKSQIRSSIDLITGVEYSYRDFRVPADAEYADRYNKVLKDENEIVPILYNLKYLIMSQLSQIR